MGNPTGDLPRRAVMSTTVGLMGSSGRIKELVARHKKFTAARRSSQSMVTSMVESLMASNIPSPFHSRLKNFSIQLTQKARAVETECHAT